VSPVCWLWGGRLPQTRRRLSGLPLEIGLFGTERNETERNFCAESFESGSDAYGWNEFDKSFKFMGKGGPPRLYRALLNP